MGKPQPSQSLWVEEGEQKIVPVASVVPVAPIDKHYAFAIPESLQGQVTVGHRVQAPFGRSGTLREAFVLEISQRPWDNTLKHLHSLVDSQSWLTPELLELGRWISRYYGTPLGRTLSAMVPASVRQRSGYRTVRSVRLVHDAASENPSSATKNTPAETQDAPTPSPKRISTGQRKVLDLLSKGEWVCTDDLCSAAGVSRNVIRGLIKKGWVVEKTEKQPQKAPDFDEPIVEPNFMLNDEQQAACREIEAVLAAGQFRVVLLFGVSGSGKTEVYIDVMKRVVQSGRQVILLVPEIALTTQMVHRFASRFRDVAVIHSGLTGVERSLTWAAIRNGEKHVIIGTRSAVFAPCPNLGLILVDEEQDTSYKNMQAPRFHTRDAAVLRARIHSVPVVMGSATPSLETWHNCMTRSHYRLISLSQRPLGTPMPTVELVDLRYEEKSRPGFHLLSRLLEKRLTETLERREQAVLLLNRRGYASVLFCPQCKKRILCHKCQASMVFHRATGELLCHHCYSHQPAPLLCPDPSCRGTLVRFGQGTERVEEELRRKFPAARIVRMDSDTMEHLRQYEQVVRGVEQHEIDILVGTQMIAKGLDFPMVSLVGVIQADTALYIPDFRASEATFQLITQVAGRAGRGSVPGQVVVQTLMGDLPAMQAATRHDYETFARAELVTREKLHLPPFSRLTRWVVSDPSESHAKAASEVLAETLRNSITKLAMTGTEVQGPLPCTIERIRNMYRYDVLLRTMTVEDRQTLMDYLRSEGLLKTAAKRLTIDVDPVSLL